jgi:hypothetical protein
MVEIARTDIPFTKNCTLRLESWLQRVWNTTVNEHHMKLDDLEFSVKYIREEEKPAGKEGNKR